VHEFDDAVIEYYHTTIEPHISKEIRDKITIVQGDILESELPIDDFDYLYFDIWSGMNDPIMFRVLDRLKNVPIHKWECWMQDHLYFHVILDYVTNKYFDKSGELSDARSAKLLPYLSEFSGTEQILEEYKGNTKRFLYTLQKDF
jgi:hypothetical protein